MSDQSTFAPMTPIDQPVTRDAAPAAIEQLRADRLNGRVTEGDYFKRSEYLHGVLAADPASAPPAPPKTFETQEEQFERQYDELMTAPTPEHYTNLPQAKAFGDESSIPIDTGIRNVFHRGGVPAHLAAPIAEGVFRAFDELAGADEATRQSKVSGSMEKLREMWGQEFDARLGRVNDLIAEMMEGDEAIGEIFDAVPWIFHADPAVMEYLGRVAEHRARRAGRR
jgi:hypothetical protein